MITSSNKIDYEGCNVEEQKKEEEADDDETILDEDSRRVVAFIADQTFGRFLALKIIPTTKS